MEATKSATVGAAMMGAAIAVAILGTITAPAFIHLHFVLRTAYMSIASTFSRRFRDASNAIFFHSAAFAGLVDLLRSSKAFRASGHSRQAILHRLANAGPTLIQHSFEEHSTSTPTNVHQFRPIGVVHMVVNHLLPMRCGHAPCALRDVVDLDPEGFNDFIVLHPCAIKKAW